jgi:hypothetical protein
MRACLPFFLPFFLLASCLHSFLLPAVLIFSPPSCLYGLLPACSASLTAGLTFLPFDVNAFLPFGVNERACVPQRFTRTPAGLHLPAWLADCLHDLMSDSLRPRDTL